MINSKWMRLTIPAILVLLLLPLAYTKKNQAENSIINGFKVTKVTNPTARIKNGSGKYEALKAGKFYKFPATIKSNKAQVFIEFTAQNTGRLLPKTTLNLTSPKVRHPKLKLLTGSVALELDKFPKDHKIEVSTPTAVCGAVGTRFEVSYSGEDKQLGIDKARSKQQQSFKCTKGEIFVASNSFRIGGVKQGQTVATKAYEGKENHYCAVELSQPPGAQSFRITMPDKSEYVAAKGTSFEMAKPADSEVAVVKVKDTNLKTLDFFETSNTNMAPNKSYVKVGGDYVAHAESDGYLEAAKEEGRLDARIKEVDLEMALVDADENVNDLKKEKAELVVKRDEAAKKATAIMRRIQQDRNIRRVIQRIRSNINRNQIRRIRH